MKVSIIIPAYNAASYLPDSIESCINQTHKDIELVIVNDGSKDNTISVVSSYIEKYNFIKLINQSNQGLVSSRRTGIAHANGEYIFFLDADDVIDNETIASLVEHSLNNDIIIADFNIESYDGKKKYRQHINAFKYGNDRESMYINYLSKSVTASLCGRLIKKNIIDDIHTPSIYTIGEDIITNFLILENEENLKTCIVNLPLYHYIQYSNSMANTQNRQTLDQRLKFLKWIIAFFEKKNATCNSFKDVLSSFILEEYYTFLRNGGLPKYDIALYNYIKNIHMKKEVLSFMPTWQCALLTAFKISPLLGCTFRKIFIIARSLYNKM